jgi:hypothetical protein
MSEDLAYLISVLLTLAAYGVGVWLLIKAVEGIYWVYCKIRGRDY